VAGWGCRWHAGRVDGAGRAPAAPGGQPNFQSSGIVGGEIGAVQGVHGPGDIPIIQNMPEVPVA